MTDEATIWPEGTDLMATLYTDGTNHLVMVQPPHSGQIPPPYIGTMTYQGQIKWPFGNSRNQATEVPCDVCGAPLDAVGGCTGPCDSTDVIE